METALRLPRPSHSVKAVSKRQRHQELPEGPSQHQGDGLRPRLLHTRPHGIPPNFLVSLFLGGGKELYCFVLSEFFMLNKLNVHELLLRLK